MNSWEEKFTGQQKGEKKDMQAAVPGDMHEGLIQQTSNDPSFSGGGVRQLPFSFEPLRRHLDDIWSNILLESKGTPETIMFCGSTPGEGCSFLSFHLALFLSEAHNLKTVYVDTGVDVPDHIPCIADMYDRPGLTAFFAGKQPLAALVAATGYDNLFVLPSGARDGGQNIHKHILRGDLLEQLVGFCRNNFDIAIFDGQPVASRPMAIEFAKRIDRVILVCRYGNSRREVSMVSIDKLRKNGISVTGVVLNDRQFPVPPALYNILK